MSVWLVWIVTHAHILAFARAAHRCHVCIPESGAAAEVEGLFPGTSLPSCRQTTQAMVCPENYKGCLTQSYGEYVTRTCAQFAVDACRAANGVQYCYCTGELCNAPVPFSDDEDLADGSGLGPVPPWTLTTPPPPATTSPPREDHSTSSAVEYTSPLTLLVSVLYFLYDWR